jgi:16S rRNA (cytidine1402-2'-O)-methyltransferase
MQSPGIFYLVPTPIGNLSDMSPHCIEVLNSVDTVACEDTRNTGQLFKLLGVQNKLISIHQHNEHQAVQGLIKLLNEGKNIAYVSDAGTPGISDPGFLMVRTCIDAEIECICLTGPSAFIPALVVSGLPCDRFAFEGFLPQKKGRQTKFKALESEERTIILYESPYKILKTLEDILNFWGDRKASVSREISKKFEETKRGTITELIQHFTTHAPKGEFVLCIQGKHSE